MWGVGCLLRRLASAGVGDWGRSELIPDSPSILRLLIRIGRRLSVLGSFLGSVSLVSGRTTRAPGAQSLLIRFIVRIAAWCRLWYVERSSGACRCSFGSQELWASEYPFHLTRYCILRCLTLESNISSTSHSGWPSTKSGGGSAKFRPCSGVSWYRRRRLAWKVLCMLHWAGNSRRYVVAPITSVTLKGP